MLSVKTAFVVTNATNGTILNVLNLIMLISKFIHNQSVLNGFVKIVLKTTATNVKLFLDAVVRFNVTYA